MPGSWPGRTRVSRATARSVAAEHVDKLRLPLAGVAREPELLRALAQPLDRPVVVVPGGAAAVTDRVPAIACGGIRDARRLLLRGTVLAELLVELRVLQAVRAASLGHGDLLLESCTERYAVARPGM